MGYGNLNAEKQRAKDQARIRELEEQLKLERERRDSSSATVSQPPAHEGHVTVEKTSKDLKLRLLISWAACILGFAISAISYSTVSTISAVIGAVGLANVIVTKIVIWWNHG